MRFRSYQSQRGKTADAQTFAVERRALLPTLQSTIGNRSTTTVVQTLMTVGAVNDPLEREADRVAREVAGTPRRLPALDPAAPVPAVGTEGGVIDPELGAGIAGARGRGEPLDFGIKRSMESAFGADFSGVRVHRDSSAADLSARLGAAAFTTGSDIFLGAGGHDSFTLAHELTHVVQQGGAGLSPVQRRLPPLSDVRALLDSARRAKQAGEREPVELKKLRKVFLRTYEDNYEDFVAKSSFTEWYKWFNEHFRKLIATGDVDALQWLIADLDLAGDEIEWFHPGHIKDEREPTDIEKPKLKEAVDETKRILDDIANGKHNDPNATKPEDRDLVRNVFGSGWVDTKWSGWFGVPTAKDKEQEDRSTFRKAGEALQGLFDAKPIGIVAETLAESKQTGSAGLSRPGRMLLSYGMFDQIMKDPKDWVKVVHVLLHESFHTIPGKGIADNGGYRGEPSFTQQPYLVKIGSAPHFEEVAWQYVDPESRRIFAERGSSAEVGSGSTGETIWQEGLREATNEVRLAWTAALDQGLISIKKAGREQTKPVDHNTEWMAVVMGTTLKKRKAVDPHAKITQLDVALAEGVTRRLGRLYGWLQAADIEMVRDKFALKTSAMQVKEAILSFYLNALGPIRHSVTRDREMIERLAKIRSNDIPGIPSGAPPTLSK